MWQPIADPETSRRCWSVIEEIERCLVELLSSPQDSGLVRNPSLAGGESGLALFFAYLGAARQGSVDAAGHALEALGRGVEGLADQHLPPALYYGFCGIGWVIEHLTRELFEGDDALASEVDEALRELFLGTRDMPPYELIGGLSGFGTYLVERLPHPDAAELLSRVFDLLERSAEESEAGITWYTRPEWLVQWQREKMPRGCYNLGVAHGVPGVVGFLAAAQREGVRDPRVAHLLEGAVRWLLDQRLPRAEESVFPAFMCPGEEPEPTRTAWCYGDLGVAAVLLSAARSSGRQDWEREALAMARLAARRPAEATRVVDTTLCHGTAGLAHLFNRLFQATGNLAMKEAALAWYKRTLDMRRPGEEFAGFLNWVSPEPGQGSWKGERGFLTGIAGVGLSLLAAVAEVEPVWDRVLLVSVPSSMRTS